MPSNMRKDSQATMKETPSRYDTVPLGNTLRFLDRQHEGMAAVVELIRKKKELDERYADNLQGLLHPLERLSIEPSVEGLIQPFLDLFTEEVALRRHSHEALTGHLESVNLSKRPSVADPVRPSTPANQPEEIESIQSPESAETLIGGLAEVTSRQEACFKVVKNSIPKLQTWFERLNTKIIADDVTAEISDFKMPPEEVNYRQSVLGQQNACSKLREWYRRNLPSLLEKQHAHLEDVCTLVKRTSTEYMELTTNIATSISTLLGKLTAFSPLQAAAVGDYMAEKEALSGDLDPVVYHNYMTDGAVASCFIGSNTLAIALLDNHMKGLKKLSSSNTDVHSNPNKAAQVLRTCFAIEKRGVEAFNYRDILSSHGRDVLLALAFLEFANVDPLFPLSEQTMRQNSKGLPRKVMPQIMREATEKMKRSLVPITMDHIRYLFTEYDIADTCEILAGTKAAKLILLDISRKWDFDKDVALPEGVVRSVEDSPAIIKLF